ncbi:MAG: lipopolysaccharide assembly protein LapA domain-containing protein [Alphaproteobacteria bacterium]|nr:lipopolysaccharide assembly protein LapA domain-containing protein [Alphaproteobacteria bacterium]
MRKILTTPILALLSVMLVIFAVANRHPVTVSFDPFLGNDPALSVALPLFVVLILVAILGVIAGGSAAWLGQRRWRRAARRHAREARLLKAAAGQNPENAPWTSRLPDIKAPPGDAARSPEVSVLPAALTPLLPAASADKPRLSH